MIARVYVSLPYSIALPEGEQFELWSYSYKEYKITTYPLRKSNQADKHSDYSSITLDGVKGFNADTLEFHFQKDSFDRSQESPFEPSAELVTEVANDFLNRLRFVTNASQIKPLQPTGFSYQVRYLNDDLSELLEQKGLVRGFGGKKVSISFVAVNKEVWANTFSLHPFQELPIWKSLLLDARNVLPEIGPAVILTFTALEVYISKTLDNLAIDRNLDPQLWSWINDRGFYLKDPSIDERFNFLCRWLTGRTIKDNGALWESFKNLQAARNTFAHTGIAKIGNQVVDLNKAIDLIKNATSMIEYIQESLPETMRWPEFKHQIQIEVTAPIFDVEKEKDKE